MSPSSMFFISFNAVFAVPTHKLTFTGAVLKSEIEKCSVSFSGSISGIMHPGIVIIIFPSCCLLFLTKKVIL